MTVTLFPDPFKRLQSSPSGVPLTFPPSPLPHAIVFPSGKGTIAYMSILLFLDKKSCVAAPVAVPRVTHDVNIIMQEDDIQNILLMALKFMLRSGSFWL